MELLKRVSFIRLDFLTIDNKMVMIPNGKLADSCITNVSMMDKRMLDLRVTVSYSTDLAFAKSVLESVVTSGNRGAILALPGEQNA